MGLIISIWGLILGLHGCVYDTDSFGEFILGFVITIIITNFKMFDESSEVEYCEVAFLTFFGGDEMV